MNIFPSELTTSQDKDTGITIRQLTNHRSINHHPFFLIPAYDNEMQWLYFVSHRSGTAQIYGIELASYRIFKFTEVEDLVEWSVHPDPNGRYVYFTTSVGGWQLEVESGRIRSLFEYGRGVASESGMVAGGMGTTALSANGQKWAYRVYDEGMVTINVVETGSGKVTEVTRHDAVAHMQFCPDDDDLLFFAGNFTQRLWTVTLDGVKKEHYQRKHMQWITHESWIPQTRELMFVDWPHRVCAVSVDTGASRTIATLNAWHAISNASGTMAVADTKNPDIGLQLFPIHEIGEPTTLCYPHASNAGDHWNYPFPYENGPIKVYAPQHTHPHPRFSSDSKRIVYTSDASGYAQLYEIDLPF